MTTPPPSPLQHERAARLVERYRLYGALSAIPEFQAWRDAGPREELDRLKEAIVDIDRTNPTWKEQVADMVVAYQSTKRVYEELFTLNLTYYQKAQEVLKQAGTK